LLFLRLESARQGPAAENKYDISQKVAYKRAVGRISDNDYAAVPCTLPDAPILQSLIS
jgi:hypothetical protein